MKFCVTTSDNYHHLLKVFCYMFNKNWSSEQHVEVVGYKYPDFVLPGNFTFHSLGEQKGDATNFTRDLREYFKKQKDWFIWFMEDSWPIEINFEHLEILKFLRDCPNVGRINLCHASVLQQHKTFGVIRGLKILENTQAALYRLCTQPSIWNRDFLLQYMQKDLTPWQFETQPAFNDGWRILGPEEKVLVHSEGTTKHDIHKLDLSGIPESQIEEMKQLEIL